MGHFYKSAYIQHTMFQSNTFVLRDHTWSVDLHRSRALTRRISPLRNTYFAFPAGPAGSYPVREVYHPPGTLPGEALQDGWQEAEGPLRRSRGQHLLLSHSSQMWVMVRSAGCTAQPPLFRQRRNVCTLPLSIFCTTWFIGSDLWQLNMCLGVQCIRLIENKGTGYLSPIDMTMNETMRAALLKLPSISSAFTFSRYTSHRE